jgi:AcrR family transcriptional regulator
VPKLWTDTIAEHRDAMREALLDAAGALVHETGLTGLSMAGIAERAGVGRATLYRYFPELQSILVAWHERHVNHHLEVLVAARDAKSEPEEQLVALMAAYVEVVRESGGHGDGGLAAMVHRTPHVARAEKQLSGLLRGVIASAATAGTVRSDVPADELAHYVFASLGAAARVSGVAAERLIAVTLAGLRPDPGLSSAKARRPRG